jgi:hypothetical protein
MITVLSGVFIFSLPAYLTGRFIQARYLMRVGRFSKPRIFIMLLLIQAFSMIFTGIAYFFLAFHLSTDDDNFIFTLVCCLPSVFAELFTGSVLYFSRNYLLPWA